MNAPAKARITHPRHHKEIKTTWFVASGTATVGITLAAQIEGDKGTVSPGLVTVQPTTNQHWMILFDKINPKHDEIFTLKVYQDAIGGTLLDQVDGVMIHPSFAVGIAFPSTGFTVCNTNANAYGMMTAPDTALTLCQLGGNNPVAGPTYQNGYWMATFSVPAGTHTLSIQGNGGGSASVSGINASAGAC